MPSAMNAVSPVFGTKVGQFARFPKMTMKPIFSDNARVYYKPGSLAAGGVGTVRNARFKGKQT
jgi:hypothetical protein